MKRLFFTLAILCVSCNNPNQNEIYGEVLCSRKPTFLPGLEKEYCYYMNSEKMAGIRYWLDDTIPAFDHIYYRDSIIYKYKFFDFEGDVSFSYDEKAEPKVQNESPLADYYVIDRKMGNDDQEIACLCIATPPGSVHEFKFMDSNGEEVKLDYLRTDLNFMHYFRPPADMKETELDLIIEIKSKIFNEDYVSAANLELKVD